MPPLCTEDTRMNSAACIQQDNLQHSNTQKVENPQHEEIHKENNRLAWKSFTVFSRHITHKDFRRKNILFKSEAFSGCTMQQNIVWCLQKKCVLWCKKCSILSLAVQVQVNDQLRPSRK
jgi:hypothetical protein